MSKWTGRTNKQRYGTAKKKVDEKCIKKPFVYNGVHGVKVSRVHYFKLPALIIAQIRRIVADLARSNKFTVFTWNNSRSQLDLMPLIAIIYTHVFVYPIDLDLRATTK